MKTKPLISIDEVRGFLNQHFKDERWEGPLGRERGFA